MLTDPVVGGEDVMNWSGEGREAIEDLNNGCVGGQGEGTRGVIVFVLFRGSGGEARGEMDDYGGSRGGAGRVMDTACLSLVAFKTNDI